MTELRPEHLSDERMQALLDGELSRRETAAAEAHLVACARCAAQLDAWRLLFGELESLPAARPHEGFRERVMASVEIPVAAPLSERLRDRVAALVGVTGGHVGPERLQELFEGFLPARQMARVEAHLRECETCGGEADEMLGVFRALEGLERFAPAEDFAARVMACVTVAPVAHRASLATRALTLVGRLVPRTRKAWAALSGVAVTPAVTIGLVFYAVFTHPTLTLGSLASFVWWQLGDAATAAWASSASFALESLQASGMLSIVAALGSAPLLVGAGLVVYVIACGLALRVIYHNVFKSRPLDGRYAHVSAS